MQGDDEFGQELLKVDRVFVLLALGDEGIALFDLILKVELENLCTACPHHHVVFLVAALDLEAIVEDSRIPVLLIERRREKR